jgi:UDP-3-O-[3-hydroxymyristoyl] glucosamine N-acyltransferase
MLLSSAARLAPIDISRDGAFLNLGFIEDRLPQMLTFVESAAFLRKVFRNEAIGAVITTPELEPAVPHGIAVAVCEEPRVAFATLHNALAAADFYWEPFPTEIDASARVHRTASVAERNVRIGPEVSVGPQTAILERTVIGAQVDIGAGSVLGGVGFQTVRSRPAMIELAHAGGLVVGARARLLPGCLIATGLFRQDTAVGADARVGAGAFLSHDVRVGDRAFIGHGAVINGRVEVGYEAWIGPGAVVANGLKVGSAAFVSLGAAVIRNVPDGSRVSGNFATGHRALLRLQAGLGKEPEPL